MIMQVDDTNTPPVWEQRNRSQTVLDKRTILRLYRALDRGLTRRDVRMRSSRRSDSIMSHSEKHHENKIALVVAVLAFMFVAGASA